MKNQFNYYLILLIFFSSNYFSNIWFETYDEFKVKKLEYSSSQNGINLSTTSFPIPLATIINSNGFKEKLVGLDSLLKDEIINSKNLYIKLSSFSETSPIRNISDDWKSKNSFSIVSSFTTTNFATTLNLSIEDDNFDNKKFFLDGSNISFTKWNNIFGFGFINRWWGPTHNNNLILSNFSRPSPGFYINSLKSLNFKNFLSFLGPMDYSFFVDRLEKNRHVQNPYLIGTRVSINPLNNLYLGFSRTITIGGEGRREDFTTLSKAIFGALEAADNPGVSSANKDGYDYSNQLAGYDIKYDIDINDLLMSFYIQEIAEDGDTSSTSPLSGYMLTFGSEIKYQKSGLLRSFVIEFTRTILDRHNSASRGRNIAYEHGTYKSGYRYRGLPIGAFIDTDSKYTQISYLREIKENQVLKTDLFYAEPNTDAAGRNIWGSTGDPFYGLKTKYKFKLSKNLSTSFVLTLSDKNLLYLDKSLNKNILGFIAEYNF